MRQFLRFVLTVMVVCALARADGVVRFVVLGDSQFNHPDVFERMIFEVQLLQPDFVIQVGDLIHGYTDNEETLRAEWRRFRQQIAPLTMPFFPVPGNHDVTTPIAERIYGEEWGTDRYWYAFDWGSTRHVVLDCCQSSAFGVISATQEVWLQQELEEYAARYGGVRSLSLQARSIFVYIHYPLFYMPEAYNWEPLHELLRRYPVRAVFAGHSHNYSWEERDGIQYIVLNSSGRMNQFAERAGRFHGFCLVTTTNGKATIATVRAGSVLPADTVTRDEFLARAPLVEQDGVVVIEAEPGTCVDATAGVRLTNRTPVARQYILRWDLPAPDRWRVEPEQCRVFVAPGVQEVPFRFQSEHCDPALAPVCTISTLEPLRAGVIPRASEADVRQSGLAAITLEATTAFIHRCALFFPPRTWARRCVTPPFIDGLLDEPDWQHVQPVRAFTTARGVVPDTRTEVRFLYDDNALYVGTWMEEPNPAGLRASATGELPLVWGDDDFELFLDPQTTRAHFHRLFVNCANVRFSSRPGPQGHQRYEGEHRTAVHIGETAWSVEYRIPFQQLGVAPPIAGERWGVNLWRHRQQARGDTLYQWSPMENFPYQPERFGLLLFE